MKITLKKLAKAALPYGVIWLRQEKTKQPKQPRKNMDKNKLSIRFAHNKALSL